MVLYKTVPIIANHIPSQGAAVPTQTTRAMAPPGVTKYPTQGQITYLGLIAIAFATKIAVVIEAFWLGNSSLSPNRKMSIMVGTASIGLALALCVVLTRSRKEFVRILPWLAFALVVGLSVLFLFLWRVGSI